MLLWFDDVAREREMTMDKCPYCGEPAKPIGGVQHKDDCPLVENVAKFILDITEKVEELSNMCPVCHGTGCANLIQCGHCGGTGKT